MCGSSGHVDAGAVVRANNEVSTAVGCPESGLSFFLFIALPFFLSIAFCIFVIDPPFSRFFDPVRIHPGNRRGRSRKLKIKVKLVFL